MKKLVLGLMVVALTVALSLSVMADEEHYAWQEIEEDVWVGMGVNNLAANARAWSSIPIQGSCNKTEWEIPVTVHASVAQWVEFSLSSTRYDWKVRKPGTYAANSLTATLKSNSDVEIIFEGFENLQYLGTGGVKQYIDTWYAYGEPPDSGVYNPGGLVWIPAEDLDTATVYDSGDLHEGIQKKLWNKISVTECNSACEYEDDAMITLVLQNQKTWIDPTSGEFAE